MNRRLDNSPVPYGGRRARPYRFGYTANSGLFNQMHREMNDMLSRVQRMWDNDGGEESSLANFAHSPAVDFEEQDDKYLLSVEVPGMKADDVEIDVTDGVLRISGEKRTKSEEDKDDGRSFRERSYGRFFRSLRLPDNVDHDAIDASYEDGVLELTLPKSEEDETRSRKIAISGKRENEGLNQHVCSKVYGCSAVESALFEHCGQLHFGLSSRRNIKRTNSTVFQARL